MHFTKTQRQFGFLLTIVVALAADHLVSAEANEGASDRLSNRARLTGRPTDKDIQAAIAADISDAERLTGKPPSVEVDQGLVVLSGEVDNLQAKELFAEIAKRTRGVIAIQNRIVVAPSNRSDDAIRNDVEHVLRANDSVSHPRVKVHVSNGRVSLLGKLDSLAEKRIATFAASGVPGVVEISDQITIAIAPDRTDAELRDEISALIVQSVYFDDALIDVTVTNRVAFLSGKVVSVAAKEQLRSIAEIWGIKAVDVSDIEIDADSSDPSERKKRYASVSDNAIREAIERSFRNDPLVFAFVDRLEISVDDAVVTLSGTVDRLTINRRAEMLVKGVIGVQRLVNNMEIEASGSTPPDMEIIRETQEAFARSVYLDRRDLRIHCQRAHVSLYGVVESQLEKEIAEYIAGNVSGVVHVNNALAIDDGPSKKSDSEIQSDLKRKLQFALLDRGSTVRVTVEDGVAILQGTVDTWRQWQAAMDLAIEAGAHHPHNLIDVRYHPPHAGLNHFVPR